jgi:tetraacyldisaccharide 4'-kinase
MQVLDRRTFKPPEEMGGLSRALAVPLLAGLSVAYGAGVWVWRRLPVGAADPGLPVISVGSIAVGGTGKTPVCIKAAEELAAIGSRVCIVSRGYRRRVRKSPLVVSDGRGNIAGVDESGDEPYAMARRLPEVSVVVDGNRARAIARARQDLKPDVVVLDDGFQYRDIRKHLDIVCMDTRSLAAGSALIPLGVLRETWSAVGPRSVVVAVVGRGEAGARAIEAARRRSSKVLVARRFPVALTDGQGRPVPVETIKNGAVALVSGIGRPDAFEQTCADFGLRGAVSMRFDDHHWYTKHDAARIERAMAEYGCAGLVTTEKDVPKLPGDLRQRAWVLRTDIRFEESEAFRRLLSEALGGGQ